jgi:predicted dehydrogenase
MSNVTRRDFMKVAGATAGIAVATGYNPLSYAANERIRVGMIGTGGQGCKHIEYGIVNSPRLSLTAICDTYKPHREAALKLIDANYPEDEAMEVKEYAGDYRDMLDNEELDAVVISTPLDTHHEIVMECLDRRLWVFCEKCLAYTIEQCRDIVQKCHDVGRFCQVGHQRRYNPVYNKALWLARDTPLIGRINHISAHWHRNDDWRRFVDPDYKMDAMEAKHIKDLDEHLNWRLYFKRSGGLMTELGTHQTDIATWFLGVPPSKVTAYGGTDYWLDDRSVEDNVAVIYKYDIPRSAQSFQPAQPRTEHQRPTRLTRPYAVRFTYSSITANAKKGATEVIHGDIGTIELSEQLGGRLYAEYGPIADREALEQKLSAAEQANIVATRKSQAPPTAFQEGIPIQIVPEEESDEILEIGQKEIDAYQFVAFANDIVNGTTPKSNEYVGLLTAITGLTAVQSWREEKEIDIDPAWYKFDFDTPDPYRYDYFPGPEAKPGPPTEDGAAPPEDAPVPEQQA